MAAYHQHYLKSSFDQPRIVKACDYLELRPNVRFEFSHQVEWNVETEAKGFTACCENNYGKGYKLLYFT